VESLRPMREAGERVVIVEDQVSAVRHGVGFPFVGGLGEELADPGDRRFGFVRVDVGETVLREMVGQVGATDVNRERPAEIGVG